MIDFKEHAIQRFALRMAKVTIAREMKVVWD